MKTIWKIFLQDLKSLNKNLIIFAVIIGITILPALYAWFNIASNWDPYSNTGGLNFAVCSLDKGYSYEGIEISGGTDIIDNLKANNAMGWKFYDTEDEAVQSVKDGECYAAVVIPEDFSENLLSVTNGKFKQAKLHYYVNEKKNAIAPKITDKGIEAIESSVDSTYVSTLAKTIAIVLNVSAEEIEKDKVTLAEKVTEALTNAKADVESFNDSTTLLISTLDSVGDLVDANIEMKPAIEAILSEAGVFMTDIKSAVSSIKSTAGQLTSVLDNFMGSCDTYMESVSSQLDSVFDDLSGDAGAVAAKLKSVEVFNQKIITVNNQLISILETIESSLGIDCSRLLSALDDANAKQQAIIDKIDSICDNIQTTGSIPANVQSELEALVSDAKTQVGNVESEFSSVRDDIDNALNSSFSSLDDIAGFAQTASLDDSSLDKAFKSASATVDDLKSVLQDIQKYLTNLTERIDKAVTRVDELKGDQTLENMLLPIIKNPNALGEFIASPVSYETNRIYPIEYYGSAMTPFYSSLALWVGGVVLVAVLNVDLTEDDKKRIGKANSTQLFFGRYLVFFGLSMIQALIIGLGDLFFLKVQSDNAFLFIITCLISSFVYSLIIYSLTITFGVIGKALAVIILILQVAGSGGTFPIEVLPAPFQALAPFLPFKYGVNALRETVAGVNMSQYLKYVGCLLLFIIPALVLGLLLRKPCIKVMGFFNKKIEESDLVI